MASGTAAISSPHSPAGGGLGIVGRLLQRATSTKASRRPYRKTSNSTLDLHRLIRDANAPPVNPAEAGAAAQHDPAPLAGDTTQAQPQHARTPFAGRAAAAPEMPSAAPQPPQLKKKASFRDRLKAWPKPIQTSETITEEPKPRFVYEPKHAAADFSRLAVSPMSPTRQQTEPGRLSRPAQPTAEADAPYEPQTSGPQPSRQGSQRGDSARRHSKSGTTRYSYTLVEDPFQASQTAAHVPVNSRPVTWTPGEPSYEDEPTSPQQQQQQQQWEREPEQPATAPLSDYERFIARAEAQDRERREQAFRALTQRPAGLASGPPKVRPDPHRQYYTSTTTAAAAVAAAAPAAVPTSADGPHHIPHRYRHHRNNSGSQLYVLGGGSAGAGAGEQKPPPFRKGHVAQRASWAPSYTTGGSEAERAVEGGRKASVPRQQAAAVPVSVSVPVGLGVQERGGRAGGDGGYKTQNQTPKQQQQQSRTLRRQGSFTQRIADYIRPPKQVRPIGKLVE